MNELELLKDLRSELARSDPDELRARETRLVAALREHRRPVRRTTWLRLPAPRLAIAGAVGSVAAMALVLGVLQAVAPDQGSDPTAVASPPPFPAAGLLEQAAQTALREPGLTPRSDQYLVRESAGNSMSMGEAAVLSSWRYSYWFPVDESRNTLLRETTAGSSPGYGTDAPEGSMVGEERRLSCPPQSTYPDRGKSLPAIATLPTDPQQMLDVLRERAPEDPSDDNEVVRTAAGLLSDSYLPPDRRAAVIAALGLIPDLAVVPDVTDAAGRPGIAVTRLVGGSGGRTELLFDPLDHRYLGSRSFLTEPLVISAWVPPDAAGEGTSTRQELPAGTLMAADALLSWSVSDTAPSFPVSGEPCR